MAPLSPRCAVPRPGPVALACGPRPAPRWRGAAHRRRGQTKETGRRSGKERHFPSCPQERTIRAVRLRAVRASQSRWPPPLSAASGVAVRRRCARHHARAGGSARQEQALLGPQNGPQGAFSHQSNKAHKGMKKGEAAIERGEGGGAWRGGGILATSVTKGIRGDRRAHAARHERRGTRAPALRRADQLRWSGAAQPAGRGKAPGGASGETNHVPTRKTPHWAHTCTRTQRRSVAQLAAVWHLRCMRRRGPHDLRPQALAPCCPPQGSPPQRCPWRVPQMTRLGAQQT